MDNFKIIAFTYKNTGVNQLGKFHIEEEEIAPRLNPLKAIFGIREIMLLSTCNRVEFLFVLNGSLSKKLVTKILRVAFPLIDDLDIEEIVSKVLVLEGEEALRHLFYVASSLDSLVVGEREIITQVRKAYELSLKNNLSGDFLRLVIKKTLEGAKKIYTETNIAKNPVSVVSLAYRKLRELNVALDAKILFIGAGITNSHMLKYFRKHGFVNFTIFNRTLSNGEKLANEVGGNALPLSDLINFKKGFDVIVTCTGSPGVIISKEIYHSLVGHDNSRKIVIDLAVPNDLDAEVVNLFNVNLIAINNLQEIAKKNLEGRENELSHCKTIVEENLRDFEIAFQERKVELAMSNIPKKIKEIKDAAMNEVFAKEVGQMDVQSKETLEKIISYIEKKFIALPMKMAKEILIQNPS